MRIWKEESLRNFDFWGGARLIAHLFTLEELDEIEEILIAIGCDDISETELNNIFWFEWEWLVEEMLGLGDASAFYEYRINKYHE